MKTPESSFWLPCLLSALGGYINAYTYIVRDGYLPNGMTANMTRIGMSLASGSLQSAAVYCLPVLALMAGAVFCELVLDRTGSPSVCLLAEAGGMIFLAFAPAVLPLIALQCFTTFLTGCQLDLFRNFEIGTVNTTICTGNLREAGSLLYRTVKNRGPAKKLCAFLLAVFAFPAGAAAGSILGRLWGCRAGLAGAAVLIPAAVVLNPYRYH